MREYVLSYIEILGKFISEVTSIHKRWSMALKPAWLYLLCGCWQKQEGYHLFTTPSPISNPHSWTLVHGSTTILASSFVRILTGTEGLSLPPTPFLQLWWYNPGMIISLKTSESASSRSNSHSLFVCLLFKFLNRGGRS